MGYGLWVVGCLLLVVRHLTTNDADDRPPQARSVDIDLYIIGDNSPQPQLNFAIFSPVVHFLSSRRAKYLDSTL